MRQILLVLLSCFFCSSILFGQSFDWSRSFGSSNADYSRAMAVDSKGHVFSSGSFSGTVDFDPGAGVFNLTAAGISNCYLQHLDEQGNFVWAIMLESPEIIDLRGIDLDSAGNIYCTGNFKGTVDFDPGSGVFDMSSDTSNYGDCYVLKLNPAGGFVWAKSYGGIFSDYAADLVVDNHQNILVTGYFADSVDFDPGPGVHQLYGMSRDIYVLKLDHAGDFVWAIANVEASSNINGDGKGKSIAVDQNDNIYLAGDVGGEVDFDPGPGQYVLVTNPAVFDGFIQKLDQNGNFQWAKKFSSTFACFPHSIVVDQLGAVYTTGIYDGTIDADPSFNNLSFTSTGGWDIFLQKLDANGNLEWAHSYGSTSPDYGRGLSMDGNGDIYVAGDFEGSMDFDPGAGIDMLSNLGRDAFLQKLDGAGNHLWVLQFSSGGTDIGRRVAYTPDGIYMLGNHESVIDLDPYAGVSTHVTNGDDDVFVLRLNGLLVASEVGTNNSCLVEVSPNPSSGAIELRVCEGLSSIPLGVRDAKGSLVMKTVLNEVVTTLDLSRLPSGYYWLECQLPTGMEMVKVLKF